MTQLHVTCLQLEPPTEVGDLDPYHERVLAQISQIDGADLVVLPELWHVGYFAFDRYSDEATDLDGPLLRSLADAARRKQTTLHIGSVLEAGDRIYNTSVVFGPDGIELARYRKIHVFGYRSKERQLVGAGDRLQTFSLGGAQVGMAICYDLRFPEIFRAMADQVALYVVPATWPTARVDHWSTLLRARAIEDQAFVIGCNTAGTNGDVALGGNSMVVDPGGAVVAAAGFEPQRLDAVVDLDHVAAVRSDFPALADRVWSPGPMFAAGAAGSQPETPSLDGAVSAQPSARLITKGGR